LGKKLIRRDYIMEKYLFIFGALLAIPSMADEKKAAEDVCVADFLLAQGCQKATNIAMECGNSGGFLRANGYCPNSVCASTKTAASEEWSARAGHCKAKE